MLPANNVHIRLAKKRPCISTQGGLNANWQKTVTGPLLVPTLHSRGITSSSSGSSQLRSGTSLYAPAPTLTQASSSSFLSSRSKHRVGGSGSFRCAQAAVAGAGGRPLAVTSLVFGGVVLERKTQSTGDV